MQVLRRHLFVRILHRTDYSTVPHVIRFGTTSASGTAKVWFTINPAAGFASLATGQEIATVASGSLMLNINL